MLKCCKSTSSNLAISYSQSNDSVVLHHPCWLLDCSREAQGRLFPPGPKFVFTVGVNHFHVLPWSGNNTRELCCILRSRRLYSQPNCSLYCTLYCWLSTTATPFTSPSSPIHPLSACTHAHSLTPYKLYAHTPHTLPYSWKGLRHSYNNGNWRPMDRTWTPSSFTEVAGVEVVMLTIKPPFASSAETR